MEEPLPFWETAKDYDGDFAFMQGILASLHPNIDFSCIYRNISKAYRAIQSNAFTENAEAQNENGLYTGISFRPKPGWRIDAYIDLYRFPWVSYRQTCPQRVIINYFSSFGSRIRS